MYFFCFFLFKFSLIYYYEGCVVKSDGFYFLYLISERDRHYEMSLKDCTFTIFIKLKIITIMQ